MDPLFSLEGKTVLVVGASSGIGRHAAKLYAQRGAKLLIAARRKPLLDELALEIKAKSYYVDVNEPTTISDLLKSEKKIDVMLCTAGTNIRKPALEHTREDWDRVMDLNLKGTWAIDQAVIKHMVEHKTKGKIINIGSILGHVTVQDSTLYCTSKAGIEHMTRCFALECAKYGIQVNAIAPGYIETDLNREYLKNTAGKSIIERTPVGRLGMLDDLDGALLLLASKAADYITGTILYVDGGCACSRFW